MPATKFGDLAFADSALEESGFEPLVPLQSQHNHGTGPMSPTASFHRSRNQREAFTA
jgi:hypothetical protein